MATKKERIEQERERNKRSGWVSYEDARQYARSLGLTSFKEWLHYVKENSLPEGIPKAPHRVYEEQFKSIDFLNTKVHKIEEKRKLAEERKHLKGDTKDSIFIPFKQARAFVHTLNFSTQSAYQKWITENQDKYPYLPKYPHRSYHSNWITWKDYLGTDFETTHFTDKGYCSYNEARKFIVTLNLKSSIEFQKWCQENREVRLDVPRAPQKIYGNEWEGWDAFLGKTLTSRLQTREADVTVLFIAREPEFPQNVYTIGIEMNGPSAVYNEIVVGRQGKIIKMYSLPNGIDPTTNMSKHEKIKRIVDQNGQSYLYGASDHYVIKNIHQLTWDLLNECDEVKVNVPKQLQSQAANEMTKLQLEDEDTYTQIIDSNLFDQL